MSSYSPPNSLFISLMIILAFLSPHSVPSLQLIGATGISYGVNLKNRFGVEVVGNIPAG